MFISYFFNIYYLFSGKTNNITRYFAYIHTAIAYIEYEMAILNY
jgi:hypothetical protein